MYSSPYRATGQGQGGGGRGGGGGGRHGRRRPREERGHQEAGQEATEAEARGGAGGGGGGWGGGWWCGGAGGGGWGAAGQGRRYGWMGLCYGCIGWIVHSFRVITHRCTRFMCEVKTGRWTREEEKCLIDVAKEVLGLPGTAPTPHGSNRRCNHTHILSLSNAPRKTQQPPPRPHHSPTRPSRGPPSPRAWAPSASPAPASSA